MFEKFTDDARKVMDAAAEQARQLNHEYIGTEHILLALVQDDGGAGVAMLKNLGVNPRDVRVGVEQLVRPGSEPVAKGRLPSTPRAKEAIDHARDGTRQTKQSQVGVEHLLLGLLHEDEGVAARVLTGLGLTLARAREALGRTGRVQVGKDLAEDDPVTQYVNRLLREAIDARASDVHLSSTEDGKGRIRRRVDGLLYDLDVPGDELFANLLARVKQLAGMDVVERRLPQDGRATVKVEGKVYDLRVSTIPTLYGERIVVRIFSRDQDVILGVDHILDGENLLAVREPCRLPRGVIICTGPAGCGKTTLAYAMLMEVDRDTHCVISIEDPVEYAFAGVDQIQVEPQAGLTFSRALRHILRQDPDVIMVGEIRDIETLSAVFTAALTGHLVLTTTHVDSTEATIRRLLDVGLEAHLLNAGLAAVINQRLIRMLCPKCKRPAKKAPTHSLPPNAAEIIGDLKDARFYEPVGCEHCLGTGYRGRAAIHEVLILDDTLRELISRSAETANLRKAACDAGMKTMLADGLGKAAMGITSVEEVLRVAPR